MTAKPSVRPSGIRLSKIEETSLALSLTMVFGDVCLLVGRDIVSWLVSGGGKFRAIGVVRCELHESGGIASLLVVITSLLSSPRGP